MSGWRTLSLVLAPALVGAGGTLAAGAALGMGSGELVHVGLLLLPAVLATVASIAVARPLLARASIRQRLVAVSAVGVGVALANLAVLARLMFVSGHDATVLGVLLAYCLGAGIGAAVVLARSSGAALHQLAEVARSLGEGDLGARVGRLHAGPELDTLARTLDEMAEGLEDAIARERGAEARRRDLITAVSHDLRTPLASLRAMVEAIDDQVVDDPPTLRRYAAEMRRATGSLSLLVDDLFELVQVDAGAIEAEAERASLAEVVRSAVAACESHAARKGLVLQTNIDGAADVPCSPRLVRVLQNLLQNAIRHTPTDGTIRIEAARTPAGLEMAVEDTGEGIRPEELDLVFEPFWRADPARAAGGAGLGLALAKRIVEAMGGTIEAQSPPASGARFAIRVPVTSDH